MDHTGYSRIEIISSSKDASRKNRKVAQANTARNTAEGVLNWCVIGFAGLTSNYFEVQTRFVKETMMGFPAGLIKAAFVGTLLWPLAPADAGAQEGPPAQPGTVVEEQGQPKGAREAEPAGSDPADCNPDDRRCEVERKLGGPTGDWNWDRRRQPPPRQRPGGQ